MRFPFFSRPTLLWKILLSTSVAITVIFGLTAWILLNEATRTTSRSVEDEVRASFQGYESLWNSRAHLLSSVSLILSTMSDVRAAFSTGDQATIRDTAGELWARISDNTAIFLVTDPHGHVIASLGGQREDSLPHQLDVVASAANRFPNQVSGFLARQGHLYHIILTPVYVQAARDNALLNVLVAGYDVDRGVAERLKDATGGSEFLFEADGHVITSTLSSEATELVMGRLLAQPNADRVSDAISQYAVLRTPLRDTDGRSIGDLSILRSFEASEQRITALRRDIIFLWLCSMAAGLALTYVLARRIVEPVEELDRAAAEVSRQNYNYSVAIRGDDELGRLAKTFNTMCASIRRAREELIRQERIATIGRLSTSIVHDLRNPLAAIYGGAEMLVDSELAPHQVKRLAANIYRASQRMQELLRELLNTSRGKTEGIELSGLRSVISAAWESLAGTAAARSVTLQLDVPVELNVPMAHNRMERVFVNLMENALDAMPGGGAIFISGEVQDNGVRVAVRDTGPGIEPALRDHLFQPFVTFGKQTGLGLGLALAHQTILDHGGTMWIESESGNGACFCFRLPLGPYSAARGAAQQSHAPLDGARSSPENG
jgi:signal transduction histidine kinase